MRVLQNYDFNKILEDCYVAGSWKEAGTQIYEGNGLYQTVTPDQKSVHANGIYRFNCPLNNADEIFSEAIAKYTSLAIPFRFVVTESTKPVWVNTALQNNNPSRITRVTGFYQRADINHFPSDNIVIERVTEDLVSEYCEVMSDAWNWKQDPRIAKANLLFKIRHQPTFSFYVARSENNFVGCAAMCALEQGGYLLGSGVRPQYRGRGVYRAMIQARMDRIKELGKPFVFVNCDDASSTPIIRKLDFIEINKSSMYFFE